LGQRRQLIKRANRDYFYGMVILLILVVLQFDTAWRIRLYLYAYHRIQPTYFNLATLVFLVQRQLYTNTRLHIAVDQELINGLIRFSSLRHI
jgi:uncharacterized membrane protein